MRNRWWVLIGVCALLVGGGYGAKYYLTQKVANQVVQMANDPAIKKAIDKAVAEGNGQKNVADLLKSASGVNVSASSSTNATSSSVPENTNSVNGSSPTTSSNSTTGTAENTFSSGNAVAPSSSGSSQLSNNQPHFSSRSEAISYAMSKFSVAEIAQYMSDYSNRKHLSAAEKREVKSEILSRFTASELQALQQAAAN